MSRPPSNESPPLLPRCGPAARNGRLIVFGVLCSLWFGAVVGRLAYFQILLGGEFAGLAESQHFANVRIWAERGAIYDRNGTALAVSRPARLVVVDTAALEKFAKENDRDKTALLDLAASRLAEVLEMKPAEVSKRLAGPGVRTVAKIADLGQIARVDEAKKDIPGLAHVAEKGLFVAEEAHMKLEQDLLDDAQAAYNKAQERFRTERERLKPNSAEWRAAGQSFEQARIDFSEAINRFEQQKVIFERESRRYYPQGAAAAHVLGFVDAFHHGKGGIELKFDALLDGKPGRRRVQYGPSKSGRVEYDSATTEVPLPGSSLYLTIDERIQASVEIELDRAVERTGARRASAIVMDPENGDILALANWPTFDPNVPLAGEDDAAIRESFATSQVYEPGSTFKIVAVAAALEMGKARPSDVFDCLGGSIAVPGGRIKDHRPFGRLTVAEIVQNSSNVGAILLALLVDRQPFYEYVRAFGFGQATGVEAPGETAGILHDPSRWDKRTLHSMAIGHAVAVTPLQVARAFAVIANGGELVQPRLVHSIRKPTGEIETLEPGPRRRAISPKTAAEVRAMLEQTVAGGTAKLARVDGYRVAGKTGTAQVVGERGTGYSTGRHIASFAGFAPVNDPSVVVVVVIDSPAGSQYFGGQVAAPVAPPIFAHALRVRDVPPTESIAIRRPPPAGPPGAGAAPAEDSEPRPPMAPAGPFVASDGALLVTVQGPSRQAAAAPGRESAEEAAETAARRGVRIRPMGLATPDFRGSSMREVNATASGLGLRVEMHGSGVAVRQTPPPGAPIGPGDTVRVDFGRVVSEARPGR